MTSSSFSKKYIIHSTFLIIATRFYDFRLKLITYAGVLDGLLDRKRPLGIFLF